MDIFEIAKAKKLFGGGGGKREGTAIPRGEVVERIYFNVNNTAEETLAILKQLTYVQTPLLPFPINVIYANTADGVTGSVILAVKLDDTEYCISELWDITSEDDYILFRPHIGTIQAAGFNGWNFEYKDGDSGVGYTSKYRRVGIYAMDLYTEGQPLTDFNGIPIGTENEKLKNVLSITPF